MTRRPEATQRLPPGTGNRCCDRRHHGRGCGRSTGLGRPSTWRSYVVILGIILLIIGLVASLSILVWLGIILVIVGLVLNFVPIGGTRRRYY